MQLQFASPAEAYRNVPTWNLVRAWAVFSACRWAWLVQNADRLLGAARKLLGDRVVSLVVRPTFFKHFCAGESEDTIRPTIEFLNRNGIGAILDYAAEADVPDAAAADPATQLGDREGVDSARVYDYVTELECDENAKIFQSAISAVGNVSPTGFAAIKVTALGNPQVLERTSTALTAIRGLFATFDVNGDGKLTKDELFDGARAHFDLDPGVERRLESIWETQTEATGADQIDLTAFVTALQPHHTAAIAARCKAPGQFAGAALTAEEVELAHGTFRRAEQLVEFAESLGVRVMIDAEHSYFQPAIDNIVLKLQRRFNRREPRVYNTIQCYLVNAERKLAEHILLSDRERWHFACKIVRGAYMVLERDRAAEMGYPSPIHRTIDATHRCFDQVAATIMGRTAVETGRSGINMLVATHNQRSIEKVVAAMRETGVNPRSGGVAFGQLLGMSDHISFTLGNAGFAAYKYLPYGPEHEVLPYVRAARCR